MSDDQEMDQDKIQVKTKNEIEQLERSIAEIGEFAKGIEQHNELSQLQQRLEHLRLTILTNLTSIDRVKLARHPNRPYMLDYVERISPTFLRFTATVDLPMIRRWFAEWRNSTDSLS